jgi:fucose 4-O-acetylase-like acetyltransferase
MLSSRPFEITRAGWHAPMPIRRRLLEIDTAKGIAITSVVWGHIVARDVKPQGNEWWYMWYGWYPQLYSFHMAFFFFLGGVVFFSRPIEEWPARSRKSAIKLMSAYCLFLVIIYLVKAITTRILHVDRPVGNFFDELRWVVFYPTDSFVGFLWFIPCFLILLGIVTACRSLFKVDFKWLLALSFVLHLLSVTDQVTKLFELHQVSRYLFFLLLAALCLEDLELVDVLLRRYWLRFFSVFIAVLVLVPVNWLPTFAGLLCVPALLGLSLVVDRWSTVSQLLQFVGRSSLTIYLMNTMALGLVRGIVLKFWSWDDWRFVVVAPVMLCAGLFLPIAVQRLIFSRPAWLNRITR